MSSDVIELLAVLFKSVTLSVSVVLFMILVGERLVRFFEPIVRPLVTWAEARLPVPEGWVMMVVSWVLIGLVVAATELNIFAPFVPKPWIGRVLTVIFCGGGSNMLHDVWPTPRLKD